MISVPNRQQRSNGNKWLWVSMLLISFTISCDLFKKLPDDPVIDDEEDLTDIQGPVQRDPETGEIQAVTVLSEQMDTVEWTLNSEDRFPPITSDTPYDPASNPDGVVTNPTGPYRISMLLPFFTDRYYGGTGDIYENSSWALDFYGGAKMGMDQLDAEGAQIHFNIYDTRGSEATTNQILIGQPAIASSDMIIGPYLSSNARVVAGFAKRNEIPAVIPYSPSSSLSTDNPYLVQVNPTFRTHAQNIVKHVRSTHAADQVVLVVPNKPEEIQRLAFFQEANYEFMGSEDSLSRFQEFVVMDETADLQNTDIGPYLRADKRTIFILPTWQNETFVYSFLRKLKIAQAGFSEVSVYGMPQWMYFEQVDYSLYEDLNLHVSNFFYADEYAEEIKKFKQDYFDLYGKVPTEEAFVGYGLTLYFGRLLSQYGKEWLENLDSADGQSLYTSYQFRKVVDPLVPADQEVFNTFERFENSYLHILKFEDFHFRPDVPSEN
jgi:hypothetical protein